MQIYEVKNNIAQIIYNPSENHLLPSDFILIEDSNQKLIAQITNIQTTQNSDNIAEIKFLLSIDKEENMSLYSGYTPAKDSKILYINSEEIIELIKNNDSNIQLGSLANHPECIVQCPKDFVDDKLYIQSDRKDTTTIITNNILHQLNSQNKKIILMDFDGRYNNLKNVKRLNIPDDFKLPLNIKAFDTIYEHELNDCPLEDKAIVQSIILELREYLKTLDNELLPFTTFKNVVEDECLQNPLSGLMLLKNKLWMYAQNGIFAENINDVISINNELNENNFLLIDVSNIDEKWFSFIVETITSIINQKCYFILPIDDINSDKKSINSLYNKNNIIPIVSSEYKYSNAILLKSLCNNRILCKPSQIEENEPYSELLEKISSNEYIIYGESILYIPLIVSLETVNAAEENTTEQIVENIEDLTDNDLDFLEEINQQNENEIVEEQYDVFSPETNDETSELQNFDDILEEDNETQENQNQDNDILEENNEIPEIQNQDNDILEENNEVTEPNVLDNIIDIDESSLEEAPDINLQEDSSNIDEILNTDEETTPDKTAEPQTEQAEKVSTVKEEQETNIDKIVKNIHENNIKQPIQEVKEEPLKIQQNPINIEKQKTERITIYETDKSNGISPSEIPFKVGDRVYHPKHGKGVIEGFTNYSNKILFCQIEFENVGRRILDPLVAGLEKI